MIRSRLFSISVSCCFFSAWQCSNTNGYSKSLSANCINVEPKFIYAFAYTVFPRDRSACVSHMRVPTSGGGGLTDEWLEHHTLKEGEEQYPFRNKQVIASGYRMRVFKCYVEMFILPQCIIIGLRYLFR